MDTLPDSRCREESVPAGDCPSMVSLLALLESVPAMLWEADTELRFTCLTGAALSPMGVAPAPYGGKSVLDFFCAGGRAREARRAHEMALAGHNSSFDLDLNGRDLHATVQPLRAPDGAIAGVIGIALDMTERLVAERALRISEHSYRSLVEETPYAICRSTIGGELLQVNRAMAEMLGYGGASSSELLLRDLPLIFSPPGSFEAFRTALLDGGSHPQTDRDWICRNGGTIQVRVGGRAMRDAAGTISHLDIFAENVTEKKRLEEELSQAQRMQAIGQLAGGVAHDFNNLLTVIIGQVEIMLANTWDAELNQRLGEVKLASEKAASLTRQLLAFSRRQVLRSRTVNLNEVIGSLMGMLGRVIRENVELIFVPCDNLGSVKADPNEIGRVLVNLAINAQDAMPAGGRLTIETANASVTGQAAAPSYELKPGDYVQILVRDTGVGMDRETQARAFEPFFTTKQAPEGTGLGLSVVYGVVRQSGGYIGLESEPGIGTQVRIYLPRVAAVASTAREPAAQLNSMPQGCETILFAEDDAAIRGFVTIALENLGYRVLSAPDGVSAIGLAESHSGPVHLLLTDLVMPCLGGRELAEKLKSAAPDLKVVFISGYGGHSLAEKVLNQPGVSFLQKPFSMDALARAVRGVLDGARQ